MGKGLPLPALAKPGLCHHNAPSSSRIAVVRIIYTYLFKRLFTVALTTTGVLTFLLVLVNALRDVFKLLLSNEVSFWIIIKLVLLLVPFVLTYTLPWGVLLAVLLVFGRFSQDQELLALKASGVGLLPIIAPAIWLGILFSGIGFWVNAKLGPESRQAFKEIGRDIVTNNPMALFKAQEPIDQFPGYVIWFASKQGTRINDVHMWQLDRENTPLRALRADYGVIEPNLRQQELIVRLHNTRMEERSQSNPVDISTVRPGTVASELPVVIPLDKLFKSNDKPRVSMQTMGGLINLITDPKGFFLDNPTPALTELQKRIALSVSCFTFVLVGIPLAIQTQRKETSIGVAISLGVVLVYYFITLTADSLKQYSWVYPDFIIWLPNLFFQAVGIALIAWVNFRK